MDLVDNLPMLVRESRRRRVLTLRDVCAQTGVSINTLSRFERRIGTVTSDSLVALIRFVADLPVDADTGDPETNTAETNSGQEG
ncbi:MAG TPA: helix-turn-helix transcriptional regulator [Pseudonocardiaceae bacterium]|nr:helix-turn-helix transcriptional regulator [Pseudonocardiaceae bacterium]